jgi:predicted nucleotidyltransferase
MTRSEILRILEQYKQDNSKKHGIRSIGIFGSQATGMASDASDVDVIVATQYPDPYTLVHIKEELEALFNRPVDLVRSRESMNPCLKKRIDRDAHYV